jgi:hypothetical protein
MPRSPRVEAHWRMRNRLVALSLVVFGATVLASSALAQGHAGFAAGAANRPGAAFLRGGGRGGFYVPRRVRRFYFASGYGPYFYSDYDTGPELIEGPPPQYIAAQAVPPASPPPSPAESEVLELQGDQWVRLTNYGASQSDGESSQAQPERAVNLRSDMPLASPRRTPAGEPVNELPPAVLVYRDGHKEEIRKYVITGATLYTSADYWSSGSWTRKVPIAELDVPATLEANRERGAKFSLPSGPNEVMMRP